MSRSPMARKTEQALSHVSLSVNRGDFIGIIGPSGAGKSTLAACLSGAVPHHYTGTFFGSVTGRRQRHL